MPAMLRDVERHRVRLPETAIEISVLDWGGQGPPALLQHANGFCAALWAPVADSLRGQYRVFAMDARGHGDSTRPTRPDGSTDALALSWTTLARDAVHVAEWVLTETAAPGLALGIGHSFGGALSLAAAGARPGLFERLLLVDPVVIPPADSELGRRRGRGNGPGLAERARKRRGRWQSRAEAIAFFREKELFESWRPDVLELYVDEALRATPDGGLELKCIGEVEAAVFEGSVDFDLFELASSVTCPVRVLWASRQSFARFLDEALCDRLPSAVLEDVDAGHLMLMERPELVIEAVARLNRQPRGARV